jgi:hypothetical protein
MNKVNSIIDDLVTELVAIRDGRCVWCAMQKPHPGYSQCSFFGSDAGAVQRTRTGLVPPDGGMIRGR